jgi:hypothetical protein
MWTSAMKVRLVAHGEFLVCIPDEPEKDIGEMWVPSGSYGPERKHLRIGCVAIDTKNMLGVSEEALKLMDTIRRGHDSLGDIDWFPWDNESGKGHAFAWIGALYRLVHIPTCVSAQGFRNYRDACTIIPNEVPDDAMKAILAGKDTKREPTIFREPGEVQYTDEDLKNLAIG